jgi:hypothetical protein
MYLSRVSSLDHTPTTGSAKVTECDGCLIATSKYSMFIYNTLDLMFSFVLLGLALYSYAHLGNDAFFNPNISWLAWLCLVLGLSLLSSALCGCCGTSSKSYRWCIAPSKALGIFVATLCLVLGILIFALEHKILAYLENHGTELGLSDSEENTLKVWYRFIGYTVFVFFVIEVMRYRAATHFSSNIYRKDGEFEALLAEEDKATMDRMEANSEARTEKYKDLRKHYKDKYAKDSSSGDQNSSF